MGVLKTAARAAVWLPRGEGQWGMGHREPLNAHERMKRDDHPLNVRARIEQVYARRGFASIDPADLHGRFPWWGLHHTGEGLFSLTVRGDHGRLEGLSKVERGAYRLAGLRIEDVPAIWRRLESRGLTSVEADGDCPVTIRGEAPPDLLAKYIGDPDYANLPNRFESSIGVYTPGDDLSIVGPDVWVCGRPLGMRIAPHEVTAVWAAVVELYRDFGYRRLRHRSRMRYLVEDWGVDTFRSLLEEEFLA